MVERNHSKFVKLMEKPMFTTRVMEALVIATKWNKSGSSAEGKRIPTEAEMINLFDSNKATKDYVKYHCGLEWSDSSFGTSTPDYFARFGTAPTNTNELDALKNARRAKHAILRQKIWQASLLRFRLIF